MGSIVLRSEHDNLQFIRVVKYFIIRAGCLNLSNKKTKLLLYYLLLGKRFVKGLLTDIKIKPLNAQRVLMTNLCAFWTRFFYFFFKENIFYAFSTEINVTIFFCCRKKRIFGYFSLFLIYLFISFYLFILSRSLSKLRGLSNTELEDLRGQIFFLKENIKLVQICCSSC